MTVWTVFTLNTKKYTSSQSGFFSATSELAMYTFGNFFHTTLSSYFSSDIIHSYPGAVSVLVLAASLALAVAASTVVALAVVTVALSLLLVIAPRLLAYALSLLRVALSLAVKHLLSTAATFMDNFEQFNISKQLH